MKHIWSNPIPFAWKKQFGCPINILLNKLCLWHGFQKLGQVKSLFPRKNIGKHVAKTLWCIYIDMCVCLKVVTYLVARVEEKCYGMKKNTNNK